jgi:Flp pilus assembly protein TadD
LSSAAILALIAATSAGCKSVALGDVTGSTGGMFGSRKSAEVTSEPRTEEEWRRETKAASEHYRANPSSPGAAMRYAEALRHSGQRAQAAAVLQRASISNPHDKRLLGAYGRALADTGDLTKALDILSRAHTPDQPDWRILSAQGAVLDQMGRHAEARRYYQTALKIVPDEPTVLSNLGLSYALSKNLKEAETTLRKAAERARTDRRVRQNLALVVGLQGRFKEAEEIARADLPPQEAAENMAYLKHMLAEHQGNSRARERSAARNPAG